MKEKEDNDIFETRSWCYSIVSDPYQVIAETFSMAGLGDIRSYIKKVIHYSEAKKIFPGEPPCDVLLYMRLVKSLIKATNILKEKKNGPIEVSEYDAFNKNYYCSHYQPSNGWEQFPRFISLKEFCNLTGYLKNSLNTKTPMSGCMIGSRWLIVPCHHAAVN